MAYLPHLWELWDAPVLPVTAARARLRSGWSLCTLDTPYGGWGGIAQYHHALAGPDGELAQVTDATVLKLGLACAATLSLRSDVRLLEVPFAEKDLAKAHGARWHSGVRKWCIRPEQAEAFAQWLTEPPTLVSIMVESQ